MLGLGVPGRHLRGRPAHLVEHGVLAVDHPDGSGGCTVIRVLLAEDQGMVRGALAALAGARTRRRGRGPGRQRAAVVPAAREHRPDVALLDIEMPGMNGLDVTALLTRVTVMLLTGQLASGG